MGPLKSSAQDLTIRGYSGETLSGGEVPAQCKHHVVLPVLI
jgi:hypothetical protein